MTEYDDTLSHIADLIEDEYRHGYYPYWDLKITDFDPEKLSQITLNHIAWCVKEGYTQGEVVEKGYKSGWWHLILK
jgi:hypothetical protein